MQQFILPIIQIKLLEVVIEDGSLSLYSCHNAEISYAVLGDLWLYSKCKLELTQKKSISSDTKNFMSTAFISFLHLKLDFRYSSLRFVKLSWS